ncbi:MAG TPA: oligoendopeptidase F [Firmicutes bacterium]|nr:oligoendopeptidase F [Candidatus Fermentithermobacillaceae bacterium]
MARQLTRSEVPVHTTWNLEDIFPSAEAWEAEMKAVAGLIPTVTRYKGRLHESSKVLLECLEAQEALHKRLVKVTAYASLNNSADGTSPANQAMAGRASALATQIRAETTFIESEILSMPDETIKRYLDEEPGLEPFRLTVEKLLESKPHRLHPETEKALAALGEVLNAPSMIYSRSRAADMKFEPVEDSKGALHPMSFGRYEDAADLVLRRNAYKQFTERLKAYQNTYGATWGTEVKKNVVMARLRGYPSAIHMLLDRQEVTIDIYNNLHDIILTELAPHMRKYARLRKKVLGLDKMLYCDIEAPLDPEYEVPTTFEEAKDIILNGLSVLGPEYIEIMREALNNRWVDYADNVGKQTGAFCSSVYGVHPYISMTWTGSLRNALTLAHELGHAGQGVLAQRYQAFANTRPTMFFIEAPSTCNETLVGDYILSQSTDKRKRRWLIMQFLKTYHHNFVRHLIEGELQRRAYALAEKGQPITAAVLNRLQGEILDEFWGGEVEIDDGARLVWMRQSHYYRGLYPYTYSAGLTIGTMVAKAIREEGAPAAERWVNVLKAGGTMKPLELAKMAGVDMTKPDPIREAVTYVGKLVDEVVESFEEELSGKKG